MFVGVVCVVTCCVVWFGVVGCLHVLCDGLVCVCGVARRGVVRVARGVRRVAWCGVWCGVVIVWVCFVFVIVGVVGVLYVLCYMLVCLFVVV